MFCGFKNSLYLLPQTLGWFCYLACILDCTVGRLKPSLRGMTDMQLSKVTQAVPKAMGNFIKTSQGKGLHFPLVLS